MSTSISKLIIIFTLILPALSMNRNNADVEKNECLSAGTASIQGDTYDTMETLNNLAITTETPRQNTVIPNTPPSSPNTSSNTHKSLPRIVFTRRQFGTDDDIHSSDEPETSDSDNTDDVDGMRTRKERLERNNEHVLEMLPHSKSVNDLSRVSNAIGNPPIPQFSPSVFVSDGPNISPEEKNRVGETVGLMVVDETTINSQNSPTSGLERIPNVMDIPSTIGASRSNPELHPNPEVKPIPFPRRRRTSANPGEQQYLRLLRDIISFGKIDDDVDGDTIQYLTDKTFRFSLDNGQIPILTTRKVDWVEIVTKALSFLNRTHGLTSILNQYTLKRTIYRRIVESRKQLPTSGTFNFDKNPPYTFQLSVQDDGTYLEFNIVNSIISCTVTQVYENIISRTPIYMPVYALVTIVLAREMEVTPGDYIYTFNNCHIHPRHGDLVKQQLKTEPTRFPTVSFLHSHNRIDQYRSGDIILHNYRPVDTIVDSGR